MSAGITKTGLSLASTSAIKEEAMSLSRTRNAPDCTICQLVSFGKMKARSRTGQEDFTRTKEKLCGIAFNCYVVCLFVFGSNVPFAS